MTSFELMLKFGVDLAVKFPPGHRHPLEGSHPWYVLMELTSTAREGLRETVEEILSAGIEAGIVQNAVLATSLEQAKAFWHLRLILPEAQKSTSGAIAHDVSVPVSAVPAFIEEASAAVRNVLPGVRPMPFGHLGDGNIHFAVCIPEGMDRAEFRSHTKSINEAVYGAVKKFQGSISAEHGIGALKRDILPSVKDPVELALMRSIKALLDPKGILNPGKVL